MFKKLAKIIVAILLVVIVAPLVVGIADAARTEESWQLSSDGTNIYPIFMNGVNILVKGINKYLNFGTFSGVSGYGFRDNGGVMEYKNNGGSWLPLPSGGIVDGSGSAGMLAAWEDSNTLTATGTPTFAAFTATSSTATSTIAGGLKVGNNAFVVGFSTGNVAVGTTPSATDKFQVLGNIAIPTNGKLYNGASSDSVGFFFSSGDFNLSGFTSIKFRSSAATVAGQTVQMTVGNSGTDVNTKITANKTTFSGLSTGTNAIQGGTLPINYYAFGDSNATGGLITTSYPASVGAYKGFNTTNQARGNEMCIDFATTTYSHKAIASSTDVYTYGMGLNDSRTYLTNTDLKSYYQSCLGAEVAYMTATTTTATSSLMNFVGSWTTNSLNNAGIGKYTSDVTGAASTTVIGRVVYVGVPVMVGGDGQFTISIDGVNMGTFNNYQSGNITSRVGMTYGPKLLRFPNLSDTPHVVTFTRTAGTAYLDWMGGVGNGQGPSVYVLGVLRMSPNGYVQNGSSDANAAAYNKLIRQQVQNLSSDGLNVSFVDIAQVLDNVDGSDILFGDGSSGYGIHLSQQGSDKVRDAILDSMSPFAEAREKQAARNLGYIFGADGLTFDNATGNLGSGSTTPGTTISLGSTTADYVNISHLSTTTFSHGVNVISGCVAINGVCAGTNSSQWTTNGSDIYYNTGDVGIGSTSPYARLAVGSASATTRSPLVSVASSSDAVATTTYLMVDWNGKVGIGATTSPAARLSVKCVTTDTPCLYIDTDNTNTSVRETRQYATAGYYLNFKQIVLSGNVAWSWDVVNNGTSYPAVFTLDKNKVGFGTTSPAANNSIACVSTDRPCIYHSYGGGATSIVERRAYNDSLYLLDLKQTVSSGNVAWSYDVTNNGTLYSNTLTIDKNKIGVGTTSPYARLAVTGVSTSASNVNFQTANSSNVPILTSLDDGTVGIGTAAPSYKLDVVSASADIVGRFYNTADLHGLYIHVSERADGTDEDNLVTLHSTGNNAGSIAFASGNSEYMRMTTTGNLGIGTSSPAAKLHVDGSTNGSISSYLTNGNTGTAARALFIIGSGLTAGNYGFFEHLSDGFTTDGIRLANTTVLTGADTGGLGIMTGANAPIMFATNGATNERARITGAGNFGLGTTTPNNRFDVNGGGYFSGGLFVGGTLTSTSTISIVGSGTSLTSNGVITAGNRLQATTVVLAGNGTAAAPSHSNIATSNLGMYFPTNTSVGFSQGGVFVFGIGANGRVGIGTTTPNANLTVSATSSANTVPLVAFVTEPTAGATTTSFTVLANGNVGVGTTTPGWLLGVAGTAGITGQLNLTNQAAAGVGDVYLCLSTGGDVHTGATCAASTREIKDDIQDFKMGKEYLAKLRAVTFKYKEGFYGGKQDIGLIAEEVATIDPRLAIYSEETHKPININERAILAVLIDAAQNEQSGPASDLTLLWIAICGVVLVNFGVIAVVIKNKK